VAVVDVEVKYSDTVSPTTESLAYGEVVPIPREPSTKKVPGVLISPAAFL